MCQRIEKVHDIFCILSFSFSNSFSPVAVAHERWGVWKRYNHRTVWLLPHSSVVLCIPLYLCTVWLLPHCIPLYLRGQCDVVCIWQFSSFFVRRLSVRCHLQWWSTYPMWLEADECCPGLLECHGIPLLVPILFPLVVFSCSYLIGGTIPTPLLVLVETIFTPIVLYALSCISFSSSTSPRHSRLW